MNIPVINIHKETIAAAYEAALTHLYDEGCEIETQYDQDNPPSKDATANITIDAPMKDPMIHKAFPGGIGDLREYVMELEGAKDHWVKNSNDPEDKRWEYTYHQRFADWGSYYLKTDYGRAKATGLIKNQTIDQVAAVVDKLVEQPFTRQAQMITWHPWQDAAAYDPPCLQSMWFRILEKDDVYYLNSNIRIRSNDAWGAFFMNVFGLTMFIRNNIADAIEKRTGKKVEIARLNWQADSFHIYGKDLDDFKKRLLNNLGRPFCDRTYDFYDPMIQEIYNEATAQVLEKIRKYDEQHNK